jgi:hypothetical protein
MNVVRTLAAWFVIAIGIATLIVDLIFHHHLGAQIFTGISYFLLIVITLFDLTTTPHLKAPFCQILDSDEIQALRINHIALLYPGAAHFYGGVLTATAMVSVPWAVAAYLDRGYITGSLLVMYYFLRIFENGRLTPKEHVAKAASAGNIVAIQRQLHWQSISEKLAAFKAPGDVT